jgi:hypothetical protein
LIQANSDGNKLSYEKTNYVTSSKESTGDIAVAVKPPAGVVPPATGPAVDVWNLIGFYSCL